MRVVVVGAGVVGAASAWRLAKRGHEVTVLEQFEPGHARGASHGSSRIFRHAYDDEFYVDLAAQAYGMWRELEAVTGKDLLTLTGAVDHGLPSIVEPRSAALTRAGLPYEILSPEAAQQRWTGMRFDTTVLFHRDAGRLHADRCVLGLLDAARERGAHLEFGSRVTRIDHKSVSTDSGTYRADRIVLAAGAWTPKLVGIVAEDIPDLRTTQEQPAHFLPTSPGAVWPSFVHHPGALLQSAGIYGLGSEDGIKIGEHGTGPVVDPDARDFEPSPDGEDRLEQYAAQWLPGVDPDSAVSTTCLYTTTPDSNFVVDRLENVVVAAGFSGHGFKFAPAVGELVADLVDGSRTAPPLFRFGVRR